MPSKKTNKASDPTPENNLEPASAPAICLLGFMGAGKTATAQILAEKLGLNWIDLDELIEARENRRISQIFDNLGEKVFREIETDALREIIKIGEKKIIALGGGTWTIEENRAIIENANCLSVWLDAGFESCWKRISETKEMRPLVVSKTKTQQLFSSRRKIYQTAKIKVKLTKNKTAEEVALAIIKQISPNLSKSAKSIDKTPPSR